MSERVYWNKFLKFLPGIALACLLVSGAACGLRGDDAGPGGSPPSAVQTDERAGSPGAADNSGGAAEKKEEKQEEIVIKSDNRGSGEEADEMLKEVDRELDALIRALDALDAVDTGELEEG